MDERLDDAVVEEKAEKTVWLQPTPEGIDCLQQKQMALWPLKLGLPILTINTFANPHPDRVVQTQVMATLFALFLVWVVVDEALAWRRWSRIRIGISGRQLTLIDEMGRQAQGDISEAKITRTTLWLDEIELWIKGEQKGVMGLMTVGPNGNVFDPALYARHVLSKFPTDVPNYKRGPVNRSDGTEQRLATFIFAYMGLVFLLTFYIAGNQ